MSEGVLIAIISLASALAGGGLVQLLKVRSENKITEADTTAKYLEIADRAAEKSLKMSERMDLLEQTSEKQEQEICTLKRETSTLTALAAKQQRQIKALQKYIERLVNQLKTADITPCQPEEPIDL